MHICNNNNNNAKIYETSLSAMLLSSEICCHIADNLHVYCREILKSLEFDTPYGTGLNTAIADCSDLITCLQLTLCDCCL